MINLPKVTDNKKLSFEYKRENDLPALDAVDDIGEFQVLVP
jgi:hypothetical protein